LMINFNFSKSHQGISTCNAENLTNPPSPSM
jgi:hypothetical protein